MRDDPPFLICSKKEVIVLNSPSYSFLLQVQQAATGPPKYKGPVDVARSLWREGGIRSIYKGSVATLLRGNQ